MPHQGTRLETDEEIRQALARHRAGTPAAPNGARREAGQPVLKSADDAPPLYFPTRRAPTPVLTVHDDGREEGETLRLRHERFVIGRTDGDLVIPHDNQLSGRHAELRRSFVKEQFRWHLVDLKSTNGTYVRIGHALVEHGQEFIIGRTRYRFEQPNPVGQPSRSDGLNYTTRPWQSGASPALSPTLVELTADESGPRVLINQNELWLGKDDNHCQVVPRDDPFASARHARLRRDDEGRWVLENNKSVNGVWLRVDRIQLRGTCYFLLGEQAFTLRIPV